MMRLPAAPVEGNECGVARSFLIAGGTTMKMCVRVMQDERGQFTAICPSLPGCKSHGTTCEEACQKLDEAIRGYIAAISNFVPDNVTHEVVEV